MAAAYSPSGDPRLVVKYNSKVDVFAVFAALVVASGFLSCVLGQASIFEHHQLTGRHSSVYLLEVARGPSGRHFTGLSPSIKLLRMPLTGWALITST